MPDLEKLAIVRLKEAARMSERLYQRPLIITTSGGKDSAVLVALAIRSGIAFELLHNHTTADAPETVYFVRGEFKGLEGMGIKCTISFPYYRGVRTSMWNLIPQKLIPPTRIQRYCCAVLKEQSGKDRYIATGVRWAESASRRKNRGIYEAGKNLILNNDNDECRRLFEMCAAKGKRVVNPIIDWSDNDVWDYIHAEKIPVNPMYGCGFSRVGCIGCPLAKRAAREREFLRYPKYKEMYIAAFRRMLEERKRRGKLGGDFRWGETAEDVFHWWMADGILPGQMEMG